MDRSFDANPAAAKGSGGAQTLAGKFRCAFRGVRQSLALESNFRIHLAVTAAAIVAGCGFGISWSEWCLVSLCIAAVLTAEMFNTSVEALARAVTEDYHPQLRDALDIASGAVLVAAVGSAVVGSIIFVRQLARVLGWLV